MAARNWNGNAQSTNDVWTATIGGTLTVGNVIRVIRSDKTFAYTLATTTAATECTAFAAAFNAIDRNIYPELAEYTAAANGSTVIFTAKTAGIPATLSVSNTGGSLTWSITNTVAATGPNFWNNAANWAENSVPVTGDDVTIEFNTPILFGVAQSAVTLTSLTISKSFKSQIGLPRVNANKYAEDRPTELAIGATTLNVGLGGSGDGSTFLRIDAGSVQQTLNVYTTATGSADAPALIWRGTNTNNVVNVYGGSVGIGFYPGDTATVKTLRVGYKEQISDTTVDIGEGVTLTGSGATVKQSGGIIRTRSALLDIVKNNGELWIFKGGFSSLLNWKGLVRFEAAGVNGTGITNGGEFVRLNQLEIANISNQAIFLPGSTWLDPNASLIYDDGIICQNCKLSDLKAVDFGPNRSHSIG